ncbi:hypothetical protein PRIPAC_90563 [Pristionchus pacificus]|uniref:Uncharacterized protein n=1 Tax=Pristionchus pacificus TaxID=54126 RepID=A0A2A6CWA1_PRIPA|nr:hypothetical protein PRIPAC_90563 [Pristionchus pacificus]|eukprot:PDM82313.1 hypothetical protein PRIPAC_36706 [Pristionchus pacificus]
MAAGVSKTRQCRFSHRDHEKDSMEREWKEMEERTQYEDQHPLGRTPTVIEDEKDRWVLLPSSPSILLKTNGGSVSEAQLVVRPSPPSMLVRHPLQSRWTLRYLEADHNKEWEDCLKCVSLFEAVVDFCALYFYTHTANGMNMR